MGVIKVPVFTGDERDLQPWIEWMEQYFARDGDFTDDQKLAMAWGFIYGDAEAWLLDSETFETWETLKQGLVRRFSDESKWVTTKQNLTMQHRESSIFPQTVVTPHQAEDNIVFITTAKNSEKEGTHQMFDEMRQRRPTNLQQKLVLVPNVKTDGVVDGTSKTGSNKEHETLGGATLNLYSEEEHKQEQVMLFTSTWNNQVWEPGGVLTRHDTKKWSERCYKAGIGDALVFIELSNYKIFKELNIEELISEIILPASAATTEEVMFITDKVEKQLEIDKIFRPLEYMVDKGTLLHIVAVMETCHSFIISTLSTCVKLIFHNCQVFEHKKKRLVVIKFSDEQWALTSLEEKRQRMHISQCITKIKSNNEREQKFPSVEQDEHFYEAESENLTSGSQGSKENAKKFQYQHFVNMSENYSLRVVDSFIEDKNRMARLSSLTSGDKQTQQKILLAEQSNKLKITVWFQQLKVKMKRKQHLNEVLEKSNCLNNDYDDIYKRMLLLQIKTYKVITCFMEMMQRGGSLTTNASREPIHTRNKDFIQDTINNILPTTFRKKRDFSRVLCDIWTLSDDWMINARPSHELPFLMHAGEGCKSIGELSDKLQLLMMKYKTESNLDLVGFVGFRDPPRKENRKAIVDNRTAIIWVMVITRDNNKISTEVICCEIGVLAAHENISSRDLTGRQFIDAQDQNFCQRQIGELLFLIAEPKHKQKIVKFLKEGGSVFQCPTEVDSVETRRVKKRPWEDTSYHARRSKNSVSVEISDHSISPCVTCGVLNFENTGIANKGSSPTLGTGLRRETRRKHVYAKKNGFIAERKVWAWSFQDSMSKEMMKQLLIVQIMDTQCYSNASMDGKASEIISTVISFCEVHMAWWFCVCYQCNKQFIHDKVHMRHSVIENLGNLFPQLQTDVPKSVAELLPNFLWKPLDLSAVMKLRCNQQEHQNLELLEFHSCDDMEYNDNCFKDAWKDVSPENETLDNVCNDYYGNKPEEVDNEAPGISDAYANDDAMFCMFNIVSSSIFFLRKDTTTGGVAEHYLFYRLYSFSCKKNISTQQLMTTVSFDSLCWEAHGTLYHLGAVEETFTVLGKAKRDLKENESLDRKSASWKRIGVLLRFRNGPCNLEEHDQITMVKPHRKLSTTTRSCDLVLNPGGSNSNLVELWEQKRIPTVIQEASICIFKDLGQGKGQDTSDLNMLEPQKMIFEGKRQLDYNSKFLSIDSLFQQQLHSLIKSLNANKHHHGDCLPYLKSNINTVENDKRRGVPKADAQKRVAIETPIHESLGLESFNTDFDAYTRLSSQHIVLGEIVPALLNERCGKTWQFKFKHNIRRKHLNGSVRFLFTWIMGPLQHLTVAKERRWVTVFITQLRILYGSLPRPLEVVLYMLDNRLHVKEMEKKELGDKLSFKGGSIVKALSPNTEEADSESRRTEHMLQKEDKRNMVSWTKRQEDQDHWI